MTIKVATILIMCLVCRLLNGQCLPMSDNMMMLDRWDNDNLYGSPDDHYSDVWGFQHSSGREYGIIGGRDSIFIIDVTDPENIVLVQSIYQGDISFWRDFKTYGDYLYTITDSGTNSVYGVVVYDLSGLPGNVVRVKNLNAQFTRGHNIFIDEPNARLYAVGMPSSQRDLCIYSLTNPADPALIKCYNLDTIDPSASNGFYIHDIFVKDNLAYCSHGYSGYYVWDFNDPENVIVRGYLDNTFFDGGYVHSSWNSEDDRYAVVATEVGSDPKMYWVDQSDFSLMKVKFTYKDPLCEDPSNLNRKTPHNPYVIGDKIYVSHYHDGVVILDIDELTDELSRAAYYDTYPENTDYSSAYLGCWGVYPYLPSGTILASDRRNGFFTLSSTVVPEYEFIGPGIDWNDENNWLGGAIPPVTFRGVVRVQSHCEVPIAQISMLIGKLEVKSGANLFMR